MEEKPTDRLVWIDLEMTGLDVHTDNIIEIAVVVTDGDLEVVAEGPNRVIHLPQEFLDELTEDRKEFLHKHGLWEEVLQSAHSHEEVVREVRAFLEEQVAPLSSPLCGNTIAEDRKFLQEHMPQVTGWLHYRTIDVSTLKELAKRWRPDLFKEMERRKTDTHRAREDIYESIEELRFYREEFLRTG